MNAQCETDGWIHGQTEVVGLMAVVPDTGHIIPPITDRLGQYWKQPATDNILVDDTHALMSQADFDELCDYTASQPSGVYPGKMWRAQYGRGEGRRWVLCWFGFHADPQYCTNYYRKIIIA